MRVFAFCLLTISLLSEIKSDNNSGEMYINDFKRTYFKIINKENNFYQVQSNLPSKSKDILATGYLNEDFNVDVVMRGIDRQSLEFYIFNDDEKGVFDIAGTFKLENPTEDQVIVNAHFVGLVDDKEDRNCLVVISKFEDNETAMVSFKIEGYELSNDKKQVSLNKIPGFIYTYKTAVDRPAEPLFYSLFNENEDKEHFVTNNYWLITEDSQRMIISYDVQKKEMFKKNFVDVFDITGETPGETVSDLEDTPDGVQAAEWWKKNYLVEGGSYQFVDLNLDCRPDMMLQTVDRTTSVKYLEFYYYTGGDKPFKLIKRLEMNPELSQAALVDIGQRNVLDLVLYNSSKNSLDVFLGENPDSNKSLEEISTFCSAENSTNMTLTFPDIGEKIDLKNNGAYSYRIQLDQKLYFNPGLYQGSSFRFADLISDGYPDFVYMAIGENENEGVIKVLKNVSCTEQEAKDIYNDKDFLNRCRILKEEPFKEYNKTLSKYKVNKFGLFDFGERGYYGLFLVNYEVHNNEVTEINQTALLNFLDFENYNLKGKAKYSKYSWTTLKGLKMLIKKTSNTAEYKILSSTQIINQPNGELNIPNVIFGLGQITNYLEDFTIGFGVQGRQEPELKNFTPIIPNSRLIVYTPNAKKGWDLEILLNPNK